MKQSNYVAHSTAEEAQILQREETIKEMKSEQSQQHQAGKMMNIRLNFWSYISLNHEHTQWTLVFMCSCRILVAAQVLCRFAMKSP